MRPPVALILFVLFMCPSSADAQRLTTQQAMNLPQAKVDHRIAYGKDAHQFGGLRVPHPDGSWNGGDKNFPLAIIIHGGCWSADYDLAYMGNLSAALAKEGIATWSIEYRRVGNHGGGWPGTFQDVANGADYVRELAKQYPIDAKRVIAVGHSAGGHLALWLAARKKLPKSSELYSPDPIKLRGVVSIAGIPDLAAAGKQKVCGDMAYQLIGGTPEQFADRYKHASPSELVPVGVKQILVHGGSDQFVPHKLSMDYEQLARQKGDEVSVITAKGAGHFEPIVPATAAGQAVTSAVVRLFNAK